jgi:hypothetical protein
MSTIVKTYMGYGDRLMIEGDENGKTALQLQRQLRVKCQLGFNLVPLWLNENKYFLIYEPYTGIVLARPADWTKIRKAMVSGGLLSNAGNIDADRLVECFKREPANAGSTPADKSAMEDFIFSRGL